MSVSATEKRMIQLTTLSINPSDLEEYRRLAALFKSEKITENEYEKLLELHEQIEIAHAERMKHVLALSELRGVSLEQTMRELGLRT